MLSDGSYQYRVHANDTNGNSNMTPLDNWRTIYVESPSTNPLVTITSPLNSSLLSLGPHWANATQAESIPDTMVAEIHSANGSVFNLTMSNTTGNWNTRFWSSSGSNYIRFISTDRLGNVNGSERVYFTADNVTVFNIAPGNGTNKSAATVSFIFNASSPTYNYANATLNVSGVLTQNTTAISNGGNTTINYTFTKPGNYTWNVKACIAGAGCIVSDTWEYETSNGNLTISIYAEMTGLLVNGTTHVALVNPDTYEVLYSGNASNGTIYLSVLGRSYILRTGGASTPDYPSAREKRVTIAFSGDGTASAYGHQPRIQDTVLAIDFIRNDYTGCYGGNQTYLSVRKTINGTAETVHERRFDAAKLAWFNAILDETYELRVSSDASCGVLRILGAYTARSAGSQYLDIGDVVYAPGAVYSEWGNVFTAVWWDDSTSAIKMEYNDTLRDSVGVIFTVRNGSNSSQIVYTTTVNASYALVSFAANINYTHLASMVAFHNQYGKITYGRAVMKNDPALKVDLGFGRYFGGTWMYQAIAWVIIVFSALLFGARDASIGSGVVLMEVLFFYYGLGWIPFQSGMNAAFIIGSLALVALINVLTRRREVSVA